MAVLVWDKEGERTYETGVTKTVLYKQDKDGSYKGGVAWNGVTTISEKPTGAEATALYADDTKYLNLVSGEDLEASIEAYTYPKEFEECDGSAEIANGVTIGQQNRRAFGLCYRTTQGNDIEGNAYNYKLHMIYGCMAAPSEKGYSTINDSPEAISFSWDIKTTPVNVAGKKPTSIVTIDVAKLDETSKDNLSKLEEALYGTASAEPYLPTPDQIVAILKGTNVAG